MRGKGEEEVKGRGEGRHLREHPDEGTEAGNSRLLLSFSSFIFTIGKVLCQVGLSYISLSSLFPPPPPSPR